MAKTITLIFILGLMVSCASHRNDRGLSSVEEEKIHHGYYERGHMGSNR